MCGLQAKLLWLLASSIAVVIVVVVVVIVVVVPIYILIRERNIGVDLSGCRNEEKRKI